MRIAAILLAGIAAGTALVCASAPLTPPKYETPYGSNSKVGRFLTINRIKVYVETYGSGTPMLLIHGNGQDISAMGHQINYFSPHYQVIAADGRGHGKTELGPGRLTYEQMAEDANALLDTLNVKSVHVLGWSDGGIVGMLLAINHPDKVAKLAIMGASLHPEGAYDWAQTWVTAENQRVDEMIAKADKTQPWSLYKQQLDLLGKQPNISVEKLKGIRAPTLVMAGDKDVIRDDHTLLMFHNIPNAHLSIFPGATHFVPWENPAAFNQAVERFFSKPFARPDTKAFFEPSKAFENSK